MKVSVGNIKLMASNTNICIDIVKDENLEKSTASITRSGVLVEGLKPKTLSTVP